MLCIAIPVFLAGTWLSYLGWEARYRETRTCAPQAIADAMYHSARLFTLNLDPPPESEGSTRGGGPQPAGEWMGGPMRAGLHWFIAALAPLVLVGGLAAGVLVAARRFTLRLRRHHLVVCGADATGLAFLSRSRRDGDDDRAAYARTLFMQRPVVIDTDADRRAAVEALGADFVLGDPSNPVVRGRAGVDRATAVVVVTGNEHVNASIAKAIIGYGGDRPKRVFYAAEHAAIDLDTNTRAPQPFDLELLMGRDAATAGSDTTGVVVVTGEEGRLARKVVLNLLSSGTASVGPPIEVRVVGPDAHGVRAAVVAHALPGDTWLDATDCDLSDLNDPSVRTAFVNAVVGGATRCSRVVVATGDDGATRSVAAILRTHPDLPGMRIDELTVRADGLASDGGLSLEETASAPALNAAADRRDAALAPFQQRGARLRLEYGAAARTDPALRPFLAELGADEKALERLRTEWLGVAHISDPGTWRNVAERLTANATDGMRQYTSFASWCSFVRALRLEEPAMRDEGLRLLNEARRAGRGSSPAERRAVTLLELSALLWSADAHIRDAAHRRLVDLSGFDDGRVPALFMGTDAQVVAVAGLARFREPGGDEDAAVGAATEMLAAALAQRFDIDADGTVASEGEALTAPPDFHFRKYAKPKGSPAGTVVVGPATACGAGCALDAALDVIGATGLAFAPATLCATAAAFPRPSRMLEVKVNHDDVVCGGGEDCTCFSIDQALAMWVAAALARGSEAIDQATLVALVTTERLQSGSGRSGIPRQGRVTVLEVLLARALGVPRIAWVDLDDLDQPALTAEALVPAPLQPVLPLIPDRMTLRAWMRVIDPDGTPRRSGPFAAEERLDRVDVETLAMRLHHAYGEHEKRLRPREDHALLPWSHLTASLRESNRAQARDWANKRRAVPSDIIDSLLEAAADREDDPGLLGSRGAPRDVVAFELLAEMEHGRFVSERVAAGWRSGDRSIALKRSASLVPWTRLHERDPNDPVRDRNGVRTALVWEADMRSQSG